MLGPVLAEADVVAAAGRCPGRRPMPAIRPPRRAISVRVAPIADHDLGGILVLRPFSVASSSLLAPLPPGRHRDRLTEPDDHKRINLMRHVRWAAAVPV